MKRDSTVPSKRTTIIDVAAMAGVSNSTVSKVFAEHYRVSSKTRRKVLRAAQQLDYDPSMIARSLRSGRTRAIGLLVADIANPFYPKIVRGVEDVAFKNDYAVFVCDLNERLERESVYFRMFRNRWIDGVIFSGVEGVHQEERHIHNMIENGVPVVAIDREIPGLFTDVIMIDNERSAFDATKHCIQLGHKRIGVITGPAKIRVFDRRYQGYRRALIEAGMSVNPNLIIQGHQTTAGGAGAAERFLDLVKPPTAIFATNDLMAVGALKALLDKQVKVPEEISVVGFDDIPLASLVSPALTTVAQPTYEMGKEAMSLLIERIEGKQGLRTKILLEAGLVIRESTTTPKNA